MGRGTSRLRALITVLALAACATPSAAQAADPPAGAAMSDSLEYVSRVADTRNVISGKFDKVRGDDLLIVDGSWGLRTIDVSDPAHPKTLDSFLPADLRQATSTLQGGFWEGEDLDIDPSRRLAFLSLDPRHTDVNAPDSGCPLPRGSAKDPDCRSGIYVISYADPANLRQVGDFIPVPAGHTTTCIEHCRYLWTGGPARGDHQGFLGPLVTGGRGDGRPIWVTDMRNPAKPEVLEQPIDLYRNDGWTDYSHDVQVDGDGIAWTSGRGGIRGYATRGSYRDPFTGDKRPATPADPVLVAGGGVGGVASPNVIFMHNSMRPVDGAVRADGVPENDVLVGTEEQFNGACGTDGRLVFSQLTDSWGGDRAVASTPESPYRMKPISTWHPALNTPETTAPNNDCSAHYFDIDGGTLSQGWYSQGARILDISDAANPRQIGYFRVQSDGTAGNPSSNTWGVMLEHGLVWVIDRNRGVEILRLKESQGVKGKLASVVAPDMRSDPYAQQLVRAPSGLVCPLFRDSPAAVAAGQTRG